MCLLLEWKAWLHKAQGLRIVIDSRRGSMCKRLRGAQIGYLSKTLKLQFGSSCESVDDFFRLMNEMRLIGYKSNVNF